MSVVSINRLFSGRGGSAAGGTREYTEVYRVRMSSKLDGVPQVRLAMAALSPAVYEGAVHPLDSLSWCQSVDCQQQSDSWFIWLVTAKYSSLRQLAADPTSEPAEIEWGTEHYAESIIKDTDGHAILNSAVDPFDDPAEIAKQHRTITIRKNISATVPDWFLDIEEDVLNSADVTIDGKTIPEKTAKLHKIHLGPKKYRGSYTYRELQLVIHRKKDGWKLTRLDQGMRYYVGTGDPGDPLKKIAAQNDDKTLATRPVLLNGSGRKLASPTPETAVFLDWDVIKTYDFSLLPLS